MSRVILVVEDEPKLADLLRDYLQQAGYAVSVIADGLAVVPAVRAQSPDLILLDLMLPGKDGMEVCRELRTFSAVPIIMTTARIEEIDRLLGLELGADDYVCKPFSPREVVARVRAVLRRSGGITQPLAVGLQLDAATYCASWEGRSVELTAVEFNLLRFLAASPGRIYSRQQLIDHIYPDQRSVSDRTVDSHIKKLRRKLLTVTSGADLIRSVYGVGYAYDAGHPS
jgi:two-component system response regulator BaeR